MAFITFETPMAPANYTAGDDPPPGRDLAALLLEGVQNAGLRVVEGLVQHDSYGWCFTIAVGATHVWCLLQRSDEWLVMSRAPRSLLQRLRGPSGVPAVEAEVDRLLVTIVSAAPHVSDVRWFGSERDLRERTAGTP